MRLKQKNIYSIRPISEFQKVNIRTHVDYFVYLSKNLMENLKGITL